MQSLPMRLNCDKYYGQFISMFSNLKKKTVLTRIHHDYITWINMNQHGFTSCKKTSGFSLLQSFWIQKVTGLTGPRKFHLPQLFQFHQALFGPGKCHRTIVHHAPPARFVGHQETKMEKKKKHLWYANHLIVKTSSSSSSRKKSGISGIL